MEKGIGVNDFFGLLRIGKVRGIWFAIFFVFGGQYAAYTYVTPFLQQVTGIGSSLPSILMLLYGVVAIMGNFIGGAAAGRNLQRTLVGATVIFALSLLVMALFGQGTVIAIIALVVWAFAGA